MLFVNLIKSVKIKNGLEKILEENQIFYNINGYDFYTNNYLST